MSDNPYQGEFGSWADVVREFGEGQPGGGLFGVGAGAIYNIKSGLTWAHVSRERQP